MTDEYRRWSIVLGLFILSLVAAVGDSSLTLTPSKLIGPFAGMSILFTALVILLSGIDFKTNLKLVMPGVALMLVINFTLPLSGHRGLIGAIGLTIIMVSFWVIYKFYPNLWKKIKLILN